MDQRYEIPATEVAVELTGPGQIRLNRAKPVAAPGARQMLARVEAVGLCFSDLKLLKQFTEHPRKGEVISGLPKSVLNEIPSYVPGTKYTVPGHEAVCRIVAVGPEVRHHAVGERVLVQTDYRALRTQASNAAFGYNFEGALQEYVLMDERVVMDPATGERFLIPVSEELGASAVCLVEPWACVEDSYVNPERRAPRRGGRMLLVADFGHDAEGLKEVFALAGKPASVTTVLADDAYVKAIEKLGIAVKEVDTVAALPDETFDDIIYFGAKREIIEVLNDKLAPRGLINIITGGRAIGAPVSVGVGRVHYGMTRWTGTIGTNAVESYGFIPETGELRPNDRMTVVGAAGPMGQMHVFRALASGVKGLEIVATDFDDARLEALRAKAEPLAKARGVRLEIVNPQKTPAAAKATYAALMAPVGEVVADAVSNSDEGCLINIFAGIPAPTRAPLDLDTYIENHCYMFGASGSVIRDMQIVLEKIGGGALDTNISVDAVCGMAGAIDGLEAVEKRTLSGKIIVYPALHDLGLVPLARMAAEMPAVAAKLANGLWTKAAEDELLKSVL